MGCGFGGFYGGGILKRKGKREGLRVFFGLMGGCLLESVGFRKCCVKGFLN